MRIFVPLINRVYKHTCNQLSIINFTAISSLFLMALLLELLPCFILVYCAIIFTLCTFSTFIHITLLAHFYISGLTPSNASFMLMTAVETSPPRIRHCHCPPRSCPPPPILCCETCPAARTFHRRRGLRSSARTSLPTRPP